MNAPATLATLDRTRFLGGSDVAAIFGVSPWRTPYQLWLEKVRPTPEELDPERRKFFARRKRQEPVIAEMLADEYGIEVTRLSLDDHPNRYQDDEHGFLAAEVYFEFCMSPAVREHFPARLDFAAIPDGTALNGEIKTVHPFKAHEWGEQGSEEVPIHYAAQVMHGLGVTRRPAAITAALFGLDNLLCFPVMRDDETVNAMRTKACHFWNEYVLKGVPPPAVNVEDVKRLYERCRGKPVELSDEAYQALRAIESLRTKAAQLKSDLDELEWTIARSVAFAWGCDIEEDEKGRPIVKENEQAIFLYNGREVGSWNRQRGVYLDQKRMAKECPDTLEAYRVEHHYRVLRLKKGSK